MPFDPDAYLASPAPTPTSDSSGQGFDPDAYLASSKTPSYGNVLGQMAKHPLDTMSRMQGLGPFYKGAYTPVGAIQNAFDTGGQYIAEKGGQAGVPGWLSGSVGGLVANAPAILGAATSAGPIIGKWGSELAGTELGQFAGKTLSNETGAVGGGTPQETPPPAGQTFNAPQQLPNYFEQKGGANLNYSAGIRGRTIEALTPSGQNPGTVGINLAKRMQDEGSMGMTPIETFQKTYTPGAVADQWGAKVGQAYEDIDKANQAVGGQPGEAVKIDANSSLKPILDEANKLRDLRNYPEQMKVGRYLYKTYQRLSDVANENDGNLTIDDIHKELQQVGNLYSPTNENIIDPVYSRLMQLQKSMVSEVAENASNETLKSNLLNANEGYSTYMHVKPDITRAAANMAAGQQSMSSFMGDIRGAITGEGPLGGRLAMGIGRGGATAGQAASQGGLSLPAKYAGSVLAKKEQP